MEAGRQTWADGTLSLSAGLSLSSVSPSGGWNKSFRHFCFLCFYTCAVLPPPCPHTPFPFSLYTKGVFFYCFTCLHVPAHHHHACLPIHMPSHLACTSMPPSCKEGLTKHATASCHLAPASPANSLPAKTMMAAAAALLLQIITSFLYSALPASIGGQTAYDKSFLITIVLVILPDTVNAFLPLGWTTMVQYLTWVSGTSRQA